jgi:hypothetical protein
MLVYFGAFPGSLQEGNGAGPIGLYHSLSINLLRLRLG